VNLPLMASSNVRTQPTPGCVLNEMQQMSPRVMNNYRLRTKTHWNNFLSFPETRGAAAWPGLLGDELVFEAKRNSNPG